MKLSVILFLSMLMSESSFADEKTVTNATYAFTIADDISFSGNPNSKNECLFTWGSPGNYSVFTFNRGSSFTSLESLSSLSEIVECPLKEESAKKVQKSVEEVTLGLFKGIEIEFTIEHKDNSTTRQYIFYLHDGNTAWDGQLILHRTNDIAKVKALLKSAKIIVEPFDKSFPQKDELEIAEATFRYMINQNGMSKKPDQSYFINVLGRDPSVSFILRFKNFPVQRGSEFEIGQGINLSISKIHRIAPSEVEVSGKVYRAGLSAYWAIYTLEIKDGIWIVTNRRIYRRA